MGFNFTEQDKTQIQEHGLSTQQVDDQIIRFKTGFPATQVTQAVRIEWGILHVTDQSLDSLESYYDDYPVSRAKFVPASGASTRMLKPLYDYLENPPAKDSDQEQNPFEERMELYPFGMELSLIVGMRGFTLFSLEAEGNFEPIIRAVLDKDGLDLARCPKAIFPFHKMKEGGTRTALEEHLVEGALYCMDADRSVHIYFTLAPQHEEEIKQYYERVRERYEKRYNVRYKIHWSLQDASTDTIAALPDGTPYRDSEGKLVFRPAGHGALLSNLQEVEADIIFIKNIDNVCPDRIKAETVRYMKALAGILLKQRDRIFHYLNELDQPDITDEAVNEMLDYCRKHLFYRLPLGVKEAPLASKRNYLKTKLNRPLRVCGLVRNEGDPGGGPFWVRERDGSESLQIVEMNQLNLKDQRIEEMLEEAKYFNPVEIVCSIRDYKGNKFNLQKYVNRNSGFIAQKSIEGTDILALELPGLWNGGMANWNTLFVEVPAITFTPVKEITDLIRPEHRA